MKSVKSFLQQALVKPLVLSLGLGVAVSANANESALQ